MAARIFHTPVHRAFTTAGVPASGEKLYFYLSGGTTSTPVYTDDALTIPHTNPVVADSAGRFPAIYLDDSISYRVVQETASGVEIADVDPFEFAGGLDEATLADLLETMLVEDDNVGITRVGDTFEFGADLTDATPLEAVIVPVFDTPTVVTTGVGKFVWRMPYAFNLTAVRASLATAQATSGAGGIVTVDLNVSGASVLSTKLTIDNTEKTSTTAATAAVLTATPVAIADDAEVTIDVDQVGDGTAKGLNVTLIGRRDT